jgi:hypothetical protein
MQNLLTEYLEDIEYRIQNLESEINQKWYSKEKYDQIEFFERVLKDIESYQNAVEDDYHEITDQLAHDNFTPLPIETN